MAKVTDLSGIQFRLLNASKGAAVRATRAQIDRTLYKNHMRKIVENIPNLSLMEAAVDNIIVENGKAVGVVLNSDIAIKCRSVVLSAGTFLNGKFLWDYLLMQEAGSLILLQLL